MRPRIGKEKWWQRKAKTKVELEKRYMIVEYLEWGHTFDNWEAQKTRKVVILTDIEGWNPDMKVLMRNLKHEDAVMWAKMM